MGRSLPPGSSLVEGGKIEIKCQEECSLCESCVDVCPNNALIMDDAL